MYFFGGRPRRIAREDLSSGTESLETSYNWPPPGHHNKCINTRSQALSTPQPSLHCFARCAEAVTSLPPQAKMSAPPKALAPTMSLF